jgi:4-hydroxybenzoate polyprenyltransferase
MDVEKDRKHPRKKFRPIASGVVSKKEAMLVFLVTFIVGIIFSFLLDKIFGAVVLVYLINNVIYSFKVKHLVILDVMSIALGFLLRVIAGAVVINVDVSPWILLCTLLLSLFLGFSKRRNELVVLEENADKHRKILDEYSLEFIDHMLAIVTASTVMAYSLYTFSVYENKYMMMTIPFVLYGIFRYQYIVYKKNEGGSPEEILLTDLPLLINVILWVISSVCIISFFE